MILFTIKKWFFDFWDNFFTIALINIGYLIVLGLPLYFALPMVETYPLVGLLLTLSGFLIAGLYTGGVHNFTYRIANYDKPEFRDFIPGVKKHWKISLAISAAHGIIGVLLIFITPFYLGLSGLLGLAALVFLFWMTVLWILASQYLFPVSFQLDTSLKKIFKKSFILFFDNGMFTLFQLIMSGIILVLSTFTAFLLLGPGSISLFRQVSLKLRLYKYDFLEENPSDKKQQIPWRILLMDDEERVGTRSLKGMIFPWKD